MLYKTEWEWILPTSAPKLCSLSGAMKWETNVDALGFKVFLSSSMLIQRKAPVSNSSLNI